LGGKVYEALSQDNGYRRTGSFASGIRRVLSHPSIARIAVVWPHSPLIAMPDTQQTENNEWQKIWDARIAGLKPILGRPTDTVLHAVIPFQLGGSADVLPFPDYMPGITYVTAEMTGEDVGQRPTTLGNFELMICTRQELRKAGDLISKLARYTCDAELEAGETMDLGTFFDDSTIRALLLTHPREQSVHFEFLGQRYGLLLCIGITVEELAFAQANGSDSLLTLLKQHGVFPYTTPDRPSVPLPRGGSFLGRGFGR
jgi:hypothetical protein